MRSTTMNLLLAHAEIPPLGLVLVVGAVALVVEAVTWVPWKLDQWRKGRDR